MVVRGCTWYLYVLVYLVPPNYIPLVQDFCGVPDAVKGGSVALSCEVWRFRINHFESRAREIKYQVGAFALLFSPLLGPFSGERMNVPRLCS